jgi:hypothetical protein
LTAPAVHTESRTENSGVLNAPKGFVPLREGPDIADGHDGARLVLVKNGWGNLDDLVRQQNRQIEENVRMIAGQQNAYYHPVFNKWIDVSEWMTDDERRWKQRPVINRLLPWYVITHSRATENQPIVTFVPGPDRADAELAEVLDVAMKSLWFETGMEDVHDRLMAWVVAAGRGHLLTRIDPQRGQMRPWVGEDFVPVENEYGEAVTDESGEQVHHLAPEVPFGPDGQPRAKAIQRYDGQIDVQPTGEPHKTPIGGLVVDVLAPTQVRMSWGPEPSHLKRKHYIRSFHTPEEVYEMFGVDVPPNIRGAATDVGELERLLYGTGFFGAASNATQSQLAQQGSTEGYVEVTQMWEAPCSYGGLTKDGESFGGRWLVTTPDKVLRDGTRPADFQHTSPLNTFEFVRIPGRNGGTTPVEALTPIQRAYNSAHGMVREHVNLNANPKAVIDQMSGLKAGAFTNKPGENYLLNRRPGVPAIEYIGTPALSQDVYKMLQMLREEINDVGFANVEDVAAPGDSGEKVKEVRFNTDRFLGPTMRRSAGEYGRVFGNWRVMLPLIWDMETTISYAGDDNIARTITVYPELFEAGQVNIRPDVESMLPEGRGERQEQVFQFYMNGMFGLPGTPGALRKFWEMARMPHLGRAAKPGGIDTTTAEQENGKLLLGADPRTLPVFEWYDDEAHLAVHEQYMKSPEFLKQPPPIQDAFVMHRQAHQFNMNAKLAKAVAQQAALNPAPPDGGGPGGGGGGPPSGGKGDAPNGTGDVRPQPASLPAGVGPIAAPVPPGQ